MIVDLRERSTLRVSTGPRADTAGESTGKTMSDTNIQFSTYQEDFFLSLQDSSLRHVVLQARAGTGKSFTILHGAKKVQGSVLFLAFNASIKEENAAKLQGTTAQSKTVHGCGFGNWSEFARQKGFKAPKVDKKKYSNMVERWYEDVLAPTWRDVYADVWPSEEEREILGKEGLGNDTVRLMDLARNMLWDPRTSSTQELADIVAHYDLDVVESMESLLYRLVRFCLTMGARSLQRIDFTDMLWLPIMHNVPFKTYQWVFVDECQDLSPARLEVAMRSVSKSGRMVFVGDDRQAIYGFAGADTASFDNIVKRTKAKVLPLPVCYRCPQSHIELAQAIVPDIVAHEGAKKGTVRRVGEGDMADDMEGKKALVICRVNAPLFKHAFALIAKGRKVKVKGKDLGAGLKVVLRHVFGKRHKGTFTYKDIASKLEAYKSEKMVELEEKYEGKKLEDMCERLSDKIASLMAVVEGNPKADTVRKLRTAIDSVFNCKDKDVEIMLSSVHRAKGLEHNSVYILKPERLGDVSDKGKKGEECEESEESSDSGVWQDEQEQNLHYVALTRSKSELVFVQKSESDE